MSFARRVLKLERRMAPKHPPRIVVRYEGPGSEEFPQPDGEVDENTTVIVVRFVEAKDGRPVENPS
jgi:hypothetical protein